MPTSTKHILEQDPLSLLFLSGFATEFFISLCYKDLSKKCDIKSYKRMEKWQICFYQICKDLFNNHTFEDEREEIENMKNNNSLNPYSVHCKLLICYSSNLISSRGDLGPITGGQVNKWFDIINNVKETVLWRLFPREDQTKLNTILYQYYNGNQSGNKGRAKEYAHFSPMLLFVRSMYLIIIHQTPPCDKNDGNDFTDWAKYNALVIAKFIKNEWLNAKISNGQILNFPYIHFLNVKELFNVWENNNHSNTCVPVDKIFMQIVNQIHIKTMLYDKTMSIFVNQFRDIIIEVRAAMKNLKKNMLNCEKQSKFQAKKKQKLIAQDIFMTASTEFGGFWVSLYIFPLEDNPGENKMYAY